MSDDEPPLAVWARYGEALARRDWDGVRAVLREDARIDDRRTAGSGVLDREAFIAYLQQMIGLAEDVEPHLEEVLAQGRRAFAVRLSVRGTVAGAGAPFEIGYLFLGALEEGRLVEGVFLDEDRREEALAEQRRLEG